MIHIQEMEQLVCYVKSHNGKNEYETAILIQGFFSKPSDSYPEITLEQFKEFVMNEPVKIETTNSKRIE